jgi:hypothetical protein
MPPTDEAENRPSATSQRINTFVAWAIALLGTAVCAFLVSGSLKFFGTVNDLPEYYAGAQLLLQGKAAQIYQLTSFYEAEKQFFPMLTRGIGLFLPPLAVPLLIPVAFLPLNLAPHLWTALLSIALVISVFLVARYFGLQRQALAWLIGLTMLSGPATEALRIGQIAPLLLLCLIGFIYFVRQEKSVLGGSVLALLVLKPQQMFPLMVFLLGANKKKILVPCIGIIIALTLLSLPFFGVDGYMQYIKLVSDKANLVAMQPELNPTIRGQVLRFTGYGSSLPTICGIAGLIAFTIAAFILGRKKKDEKDWLERGLVGIMPLGLLTSMHCHTYDLLLMVPSVVALAKPMYRVKKTEAIVMALALLPFVEPFYAEIHYSYLKTGLPLNPHFIALAVFAVLSYRTALTSE